MGNNNQPHATSDNHLKERLIQKLEAAASEHPEFAKTGTRIIVLLTNYRAEDPIPDEFWYLYRQLARTVAQDASGRLLFNETQMDVVYIIRNLMRAKGILVQLADKRALQAQMQSAAREFAAWEPVLKESLYPTVLEKAGEEMDIWFFLSLIAKAMDECMDQLDGPDLSASEHAALLSRIEDFQESLIGSLVSNPYLVDYAQKQVRIAKGTS